MAWAKAGGKPPGRLLHAAGVSQHSSGVTAASFAFEFDHEAVIITAVDIGLVAAGNSFHHMINVNRRKDIVAVAFHTDVGVLSAKACW